MEATLQSLLVVAALGAGLVAGIFFAFSTFVMQALGTLTPERGIAAMQAINVAVLNPRFLGVFLGTGLLSLALAVLAATGTAPVGAGWAVAGAALYLVGCVGVTRAANIPLNERLAGFAPEDPGGVAPWATYLRRWTWWNHVRTAASLAAAACFMLARGAAG